MFDSIRFLTELSSTDRDWIRDQGRELQLEAGTVLFDQNAEIEHFYIVLHGLLVTSLEDVPALDLSLIGPGELIGEISFIESRPTSARVIAREESLLLAIEIQQLQEKIESDEGFASRFHRALSRMISRRLRMNTDRLGSLTSSGAETVFSANEMLQPLGLLIGEFKELFLQADLEIRDHPEGIPEHLATEFEDRFRELESQINHLIGADSVLDPSLCDYLGRKLMADLLPFMLFSRIGERAFSKPRGYAGDYLTIEWLYQNEPQGHGRLGPLVDRGILSLSCSQAVMNRRDLLASEIERTVAGSAAGAAEITSLACGPARELYDYYLANRDQSDVNSHLVDMDSQALEFVEQWRDELGLTSRIGLYQLNLVYLVLGRQFLEVPPQDLVYSIGLIDYFDDEFVIRLLNFIHGILRPGGRVVLGNFHPRNPSRAMMDHMFDWKLIYRDEDDMNRIFESSLFGRDCTDIQFEEQGTNLFAACER